MQPETTTDNRKTFRLDAAAAASLATLRRNHGTENAAINHALIQWPKDIKLLEEQNTKLREAGNTALADAREWKLKQEATQRELDQLKNALALVGKFLSPAE